MASVVRGIRKSFVNCRARLTKTDKKENLIPYQVNEDPNVRLTRYSKLSDKEMENLPSESDFFPGIKWIIPNYKEEDFKDSEWYNLPGRRRE
ncbi:hypothetical protein JTE90_015603 [Oedothorax gibbosus]|uniref:Uncharacterized protein n=1 Tax=Oedothorax gibbosus TaxID=931172 RepID=A0AAV6UVP7_9ARAC|nr:hypothetical protein JTE90_015603 [Oedothorax gibbosus]